MLRTSYFRVFGHKTKTYRNILMKTVHEEVAGFFFISFVVLYLVLDFGGGFFWVFLYHLYIVSPDKRIRSR